MSFRYLVRSLGITLLLGGLLMVSAGEVLASHRGSLEERRAARDAERAARDAERVARDAEREAERAARDAAEEAERLAEEATCGCSASVKFSRPDLQWRNGTLAFIPRVDVDVRTRGETGGPDWSVDVLYGGFALFGSTDVTPPGDVLFADRKHIVGGQCGDNRFSFDGVALQPVTLGGLTRTLLGLDQELTGQVEMLARVEGCQGDNVHEQFGFDLEELGNFDAGSWRRVRD